MTIGHRVLCSLPIAALALSAAAQVQHQRFTPSDLVQTTRLSGTPAISPGNTTLAYIQTHYSVEKKRQTTQLVIQPLGGEGHLADSSLTGEIVLEHSTDVRPSAAASGAKKAGMKPAQPVWLSDSALAFVVVGDGESTVYALDEKHKGHGRNSGWGKPKEVTRVDAEISDLAYSRESGILAFTAPVYTGTSIKQTAGRDKNEAQDRADSGQVFDELWVRHWDAFVSPKVSQIHSLRVSPRGLVVAGKRGGAGPHNVMQGTAVADSARFEAQQGFVLSPDGTRVAFVAKNPALEYAWQTTSYIYLASTDSDSNNKSGPALVVNQEAGAGASSSPAFSADGARLAYLQMLHPAYEADRNRIRVYDIAQNKTISVAEDWDRSPAQLAWVDAETLAVTYMDHGRSKLATVDVRTGAVTPAVSEHSTGLVRVLDGRRALVESSALDSPTDLFDVSLDSGEMHRLTALNADLRARDVLGSPEDVEFVGADNQTIHGFILHPPGFDPERTYPLALVIHGGPQSSFADAWSSRWNLNVFASAGFVTVALDPQGSTGYGQNFTDAIRNQWGGKPYDSLMLSVDQLLQQRPYVDSQRMAALGASYGGYMINWINGHTDRFRCLVNHDGIFSTVSTYYSTEELYFPETEFEGTPFEEKARANYERWNPERFVAKWRTPTLVVHGEKDYRLTVSEGLSTFTALRRQRVPAKLLYFPDENHWVVKPANSLRWHTEVLEWITRWTEQEPAEKEEGESRRFTLQNQQPADEKLID